MTNGSGGLEALEARLGRDLEMLRYPARPWLEARTTTAGEPVHDVLIVGGGQSGLVCAAALAREMVRNVLVVDESPEDHAGPWLTFARMATLRTPKHVTGPDLGIPSLTIQAWYEAQHGDGSWERLGLIPRETWAAYLAWYRRVLQIPVRAETRAGAVDWVPVERAFRVPLSSPDGERIAWARRVVFCTGIDGSGSWQVPDLVARSLPRELYAHTRDPIDFEALRGRRVLVLGAGASAFDNAACALEHGAEVRLYFRRKELVDVNAYRWAEFAGFLRHLGDLPDADKWRFTRQIFRMGQLPPRETYERARRHASFHLHPGEPWTGLARTGDGIELTTPLAKYRGDFVILGTGFRTDLSKREELSALLPHVALWGDRYTPPPEEADEEIARHPYLGPAFELEEKVPGAAPFVRNAFHYTFGCLPSLGFGGASISGMKYSIPRLVGGVTGSLFREDAARHFEGLCGYAEKEL